MLRKTLLAIILSVTVWASPVRADEPTTQPDKKPVIVDADEDGTISVEDIKKAITESKPDEEKPDEEKPESEGSKVTSLDEARKLYMSGNYKAAAAGYRKLADEKQAVSAMVGLARALAMQGQYTQALEALDKVTAAGSADARWHVARAELLETVGKYDQALKHATAARDLRPGWAVPIPVQVRLLTTLGRKDEAIKACDIDKVLANDKSMKDPEALVAIGQTIDQYATLSGKRASGQASNILNNYLGKATQVDKSYWPGHVAAGNFLLSKRFFPAALKEYKAAYSINKRIPEIYVGAAAADLKRWKFEQVLSHADKALKINPNHPDAHLMKAICMMQWRKFDEVKQHVDKVLAINPNHLDALSLAAAAHIRMDEPDKAQPYIDAVAKINKTYEGLPLTVGTWLSSGRQFEQAEPYFLQAIDLAPERAEPYASLGLMYMQMGEEAKAVEVLEKAHRIDDYREDVVNYLRLLERMKQRFIHKETEHFIVSVDGEVDAVLLEQVSRFMEDIHDEVCGAYSFYPQKKTKIQIFPTQTQFSVRIAGSGWVPTVGACTGRVIALAAPSRERQGLGTHNWANVLRHEYAHTVTLTATGNRIPHWFTEACAVWQQPDKRNFRYVQLLVGAARANQLFPISELDWGFIRPKKRTDRPLAYAQSELVLSYIIDEYSYAKVPEMLKGFRDGKTQPEVFKDVLGTTEKKFDKEFQAWARKMMQEEWGFETDGPPDLAKAAQAVKDNPKSAEALGRHAVALFHKGKSKWKLAEASANQALAIDEHNVDALSVLTRIHLAAKKWDKVIETAGKLADADPKGYIAYKALAAAYLDKKDWADAIRNLEMLKLRQPLDSFAYEQLAQIYTNLGQPEKALPSLEYLHRHTMKDPRYARQIAEIYRAIDQPEQARTYFEQVLHIHPYEANAYKALATIHLRAGRNDLAIESAHNLCLLEPDSSAAWTLKALVQYRVGRATDNAAVLRDAKKSAEKSMEIESNPRAKRVLQMIEASLQPA